VSAFSEQRIAVTGGIELAVRRPEPPAGTTGGLPVLLVHGLSSNARLWDGVAGRLSAAGHPVAAVDQRGHGHSDKPDTGYDWATLTNDLAMVAAELGWPRLVAAGQSWGGNVVVELGARHGDLVGALALVDGGTIELADRFADWPTCEAALAPPPLEGLDAQRFAKLIRSHHPDWPEEGIEGTLANVEVLADGTVRPWLRRDNHLRILRGLYEHRPSQRWPELRMPVALIPAEDATAPDGRFMAAKREEIRRAEKLLVDGRTHWIVGDHDLHAQHPGEVAAILAGLAAEAA